MTPAGGARAPALPPRERMVRSAAQLIRRQNVIALPSGDGAAAAIEVDVDAFLILILFVDGEAYECARRYMIRLERRDFEEPPRLERLAAAAGMTPEKFRMRFGYVVGLA